MTKNVFKIGAVVLLICMLGAVGVSAAHEAANDALFGVEPKEYIWGFSDLKNWTYSGGMTNDPVIYIEGQIKDNETYNNLSAYNVTLGGTLTNQGLVELNDFQITNLINGFALDSIAQNGWKVASTVSDSSAETPLTSIKESTPIAKFTLLSNSLDGLKGGDQYTFNVLATSELGSVNTATIGDAELDDFAKHASSADDLSGFNFYVRADKPIITDFYVKDYVKNVSEAEIVYVYKEHDAVAILTNDYNLSSNVRTINLEDYDKNNWSLADAPEHFGITTGNNHDNAITFKGTGVPSEESTVTVKLNDGIGIDAGNASTVQETKTFIINVTNWNRSKESITVPDATIRNGTTGATWDFVNPLGVNYTVGAGKMLNSDGNAVSNEKGWDSHVKMAKTTVGSGEDAKPIAWNATVRYYKASDKTAINNFQINGVAAGSKLNGISDNVNFTVTLNEIGNGDYANDVIIMLSGYKKGDADLDNHVDIVDSSIVGVSVIRGPETEDALISTTMENFLYADCNMEGGDGFLDVSDVRAINRFLVGLAPWEDDGTAKDVQKLVRSKLAT